MRFSVFNRLHVCSNNTLFKWHSSTAHQLMRKFTSSAQQRQSQQQAYQQTSSTTMVTDCAVLVKRTSSIPPDFQRQQQSNIVIQQRDIVVDPTPSAVDIDVEEVLEYYEVDEEGVDVPMLADVEPYLRTDIQKRPISTLRPDELIAVLRDQKAKDIICFQTSDDSNNAHIVDVDQFGDSHQPQQQQFTIICSPYNGRHGHALDNVVRQFMKRNFIFERRRQVPGKMEKTGGWFFLDLHNVFLHIMDEEMRKKYDLESLLLGIDEEEDEADLWWCTSDYRISTEDLQQQQQQKQEEANNEPARPKKRRGVKSDEFIRPFC